ncbi:Actin-related protein 2 [Diplonema papillatum]|nr:Actin-related protein 2 [Diplonema papillatum]
MSKIIVNDNGSGFVKCGFAGSNFPQERFPAIVGRPILRSDEMIGEGVIKDIMVGQDCFDHRAALNVNYPLQNGLVKDWTDMMHIWEHTWEKLGIDPADTKVMLTEAPMNPHKNRMKTFQIMFEKYGFHSAFMSIQAVLVLYAQGLMSGCVVDAGDGVTHVMPIYHGRYAPQRSTETNVKRLDLAGHALSDHMIELLQRRGYALNKTADFDTVRQIKELFAYVAVDFELEKKLATETTVLEKDCVLPDGRVLKLGPERFECAEPLFRPELMGVEARSGGMAQMTFDCINNSTRDVQGELFKHVVLSGGTTMLPGLPTRLERDMKDEYVKVKLGGDKTRGKVKIRVEDPPRRKHMVYIGASVLAELMATDPEQWVTKEEWDEQGEEVVKKKCPDARNV